MEKDFSFQDVYKSNFEPILHNCPYNLCMYVCMYACCPFNFFLVRLSWMKGSLLCVSLSLSGENQLIIHDVGWPVGHAHSHIALANRKCFSQYNPIHSFMWTIRRM